MRRSDQMGIVRRVTKSPPRFKKTALSIQLVEKSYILDGAFLGEV